MSKTGKKINRAPLCLLDELEGEEQRLFVAIVFVRVWVRACVCVWVGVWLCVFANTEVRD